MKQKLILFDWGNIVESHTTGYSCYDAWDDLFAACGYKSNERVYNLLSKYKMSCITSVEEFENTYNEIAKDFKLTTTYKEFIKLYREIFDKIDYYKDVAEYEVSLRDKCYIGILSDLIVFDKERLNKQVDLSKYDYEFLSFELEVKKPNREIFEKIQEKLPFSKKDILFIDDRKDNVDMAKEFGWNTLMATGLELDKIKKVCENFVK